MIKNMGTSPSQQVNTLDAPQSLYFQIFVNIKEKESSRGGEEVSICIVFFQFFQSRSSRAKPCCCG